MAQHDAQRTPVTALLDAHGERELVAELARLLGDAGLDVVADAGRRRLTATQPGVGLSQVVQLARQRKTRTLEWLIKFDNGFRGADGSTYQRIADGADVATAARRVCTILAIV